MLSFEQIIEKCTHDQRLSKDEILTLLATDITSWNYYRLLHSAQDRAIRTFHGKGYIFAQIGLNAEPCSVNCHFCSMGAAHYSLGEQWRKTPQQIETEVKRIINTGAVSDLFLMTTADYPQDMFIEVGQMARMLIGKDMRLVANVGDFDVDYAHKLRKAGFTGVYHIVRLGEGEVTGASVASREMTINAIQTAGLELYYCVEPIGPENTYNQIANEIVRAAELGIDVMAVMRRVAVAGTPMADMGEISIPELCKIAAVAQLGVGPKRSMNVHETTELSLIAGVNQLYAEIGANPRDTNCETEYGRGLSVSQAASLLKDYNYKLK